MDIVLRQVGDSIYLYIDGKVITILENKSFDYVIKRIQKNFKNAKIHIE